MADETLALLGGRIRRARLAAGLRQLDVSRATGVSPSMVCRIELGRGGSVPMNAWIAVGGAVGLELQSYHPDDLRRPTGSNLARRCHRLVVALALEGGWTAWTETASNETRLTRMSRQEAVIVRVWDVIADVAAAIDSFEERLEQERGACPPGWIVGGFIVVPSTGHNRRRLTETAWDTGSALPERAALWLSALAHDRPIPRRPGLIWTDQRYERLRPMLPYLDRRRRNRTRR